MKKMRWGSSTALVGLLAFVGCSSDEGGGNTFRDEAGRSCTVNGRQIDCTGPGPRTACRAGTTACFGVIGLEASPMQSCAMCCSPDGVQSYETTDCSLVPCTKDSECGFDTATCRSGHCWCPGDNC